MMRCWVYLDVDKGDPLNQLMVLDIADGEKKYRYKTEAHPAGMAAAWAADVGNVLAQALDDLLYHDGVKGRQLGEKDSTR